MKSKLYVLQYFSIFHFALPFFLALGAIGIYVFQFLNSSFLHLLHYMFEPTSSLANLLLLPLLLLFRLF